ncbi:hypothetical protein QO002_003404 [Pararhizobium capsulatum DSM 1112]|uniref:Extensin-like C-terminal domain-containing protein n=1 Tax=Pararhizobium capsulatum DSM 1112 TaxID=1121113 RepID=A0ABU0BSM6_9HYPH|nr:extensin family protein [Pararhizobium capsulatum]MDQ0321266.1 hypothetical protein [Pararhizobium capsulatum DSM 1112]
MSFRIAAIVLFATLLSAASLPKEGPTPEKRPETEQTAPAAQSESETATPIPRPPGKDGDVKGHEQNKPPQADDAKASDESKKTDEVGEKPAPPPPIMAESDQDHAACMAELKAIGAEFEPVDRIDDGSGCGIDKPIKLTTVLPGVVLKPEGTMRCETALELARWTKEAVFPAAKAALESDGQLTTINQASSYICRLRNNAKTGKISEHARGNAIDIASFTFKSGKTIAIEPRDEDSTLSGAFQRAVTASGCLYFETVLDPGSDEAHENHLHFDVLQRRGGYRYCR